MNNNLSVKLIRSIHFLLLIYIIICPFLSYKYLCIGIGLLLFTIKNWGKENRCFLTIIEYMLLNRPELESGFLYRLSNPFYIFKSELEFESKLKKIVYIWLIILICIVIYKYKKLNKI